LSLATAAFGGTLEVGTLRADEIRTREISYAQPRPDDGILYYSFATNTGATVHDMSGHGRHGTAIQCVWTNEGRFAGGAMSWTGTNSWSGAVVAGDALDFPSWDTYTLSVWFRYVTNNFATGSHNDYVMVDKSNGGGGYIGAGIGLLDSGGLYFWLWGVPGTPAIELHDTSKSYSDGQWHHAVAVRNGSVGQLWADGNLKVSTNGMFSVTTGTAAPLSVGNIPGLQSLYSRWSWSGSLDEFRVYDRALTSEEIGQLYINGLFLSSSGSDIITVSAPLSVSGALTVGGDAVFRSGIRYVKPLGDLSSGIYTNSAPWH
jgi:hypothetical protein